MRWLEQGRGFAAGALSLPLRARAAARGSVQSSVAKPCARVAGWFERMQKRPSFAPAVTGWLTDADRERFAAPPDEARHKLRAILNLP